ncbi:MAG TPA: Dam family site-specific DNA-(adenine-N6)-methyltransferase, partial [Thermoanaerobaculia bacterium]
MRSIIRWAGSKRQILKKLRPYWSDAYTTYIEPFAGSACLFFDIQPSTAILADLNSELVLSYIALKENVELVLEHFKKLRPDKETYYKVRAINPGMLSMEELAARFIYLNRYCFNGLYRTNLEGKFNVPYGPPKQALLNFEQEVRLAAVLLQQTTLKVSDFESTVAAACPNDFVYLDPPYMVQTRRIFREYSPQPFSIADLDRLSECLCHLDDIGA